MLYGPFWGLDGGDKGALRRRWQEPRLPEPVSSTGSGADVGLAGPSVRPQLGAVWGLSPGHGRRLGSEICWVTKVSSPGSRMAQKVPIGFMSLWVTTLGQAGPHTWLVLG